MIFPHPILASKDDEEFIIDKIRELPSAFQAFFETFGEMYEVENSAGANEGVMVHADSEERMKHIHDLKNCVAFHYAGIQKSMSDLRSVPPTTYRNAIDGTQNTELTDLIAKMTLLWSDNGIKLNDKVQSWAKPIQKLADDAVKQLTITELKFPLKQRLLRAMVTKKSTISMILVPSVLGSVMLSTLSSLAFTTFNFDRTLAISVVGVLSLFAVTLVAITNIAYLAAMKALEDLYEAVFVRQFTMSNFVDISKHNHKNIESGVTAHLMGTGTSILSITKKDVDISTPSELILQPPFNNPNHEIVNFQGDVENNSSSNKNNSNNSSVRPTDMTNQQTSNTTYSTQTHSQRAASIDVRYLNSHIVMIGFDDQYNVVMWNAAAEAATGFLESECLGKPITELIDPPYPNLMELTQEKIPNAVKIHLKAFATASIPMFTVVAPVVMSLPRAVVQNANKSVSSLNDYPSRHDGQDTFGNNDNAIVGHALICATGKDDFQEGKQYIINYFSFQIGIHLNRIISSYNIPKNVYELCKALNSIVSRGDAKQMDETAKSMVYEWEWTTGQQLLSKSLSSHLNKCTAQPLDRRYFPTSIFINLQVVSEVLEYIVGASPARCEVDVDVFLDPKSKVSCLVMVVRISNTGVISTQLCKSVLCRTTCSTTPITSMSSSGIMTPPENGNLVSVSNTCGYSPQCSSNISVLTAGVPTIKSALKTHKNTKGDFVTFPDAPESSVSSQRLPTPTSQPLVTARFDMSMFQEPKGVVFKKFEECLGVITVFDECTAIELTAPCQIIKKYDEDDGEFTDAADDSAIGSGGNKITCTVNVLTMISNFVDQHNLSMVLLKIPFVSLTSLRDANDVKDLYKKLHSNNIDVVMADKASFWEAKAAIGEYPGVILVPLLDTSVTTDVNTPYVIRTPIGRAAVQAAMQEIGLIVENKKNVLRQKEERERILASRQDSPWTQGRLLGRGAYGAVYEATSDLTGGKMAVKMFYFKKGADTEQEINVMLQEIKIMCELNNPNIVHYFYCERKDNNLNLFMELCDGSLADYLSDSQKLNNSQIANLTMTTILEQVVKALVYLHEKGITHRDIKPQNILLKGNVVKMTDFGTARENKNEDLVDVQGTFRYMAPEVYCGHPHAQSCDIWSLGCLTAELLGAPLLFMDKRHSSLLGEMTTVELPAGLKGEARDFVQQCLQIDPQARPKAAMLLLHPFLTHEYEVQTLLQFANSHARGRDSVASRASAFSLSSQVSSQARIPSRFEKLW